MPIPVALIAGLHGTARTAAVDLLLRRHPRAVAIHHDLRSVHAGRIERQIRDVSGVLVADAGPWLAALSEGVWGLIAPVRRAAAALDWNPIVGDRVQHLVLTGPDLDRDRIVSLLDSCLIGRHDALPGAAEWAVLDDPFAPLLDLSS